MGKQGPGCMLRAAMGGQTTWDMTEDAGTRSRAQIKQRRLAGGGGEQHPAIRRSVSRKEVGRECKVAVVQQRPLIMGGSRRGGNKKKI